MKRVLYDPDEGIEYSAHAGDYWNIKPDTILKNANGRNLWLVVDDTVKKKTVRKKDLIDEIYEAQNKQSRLFKRRRSIGRDRLYRMFTNRGTQYIVDGKGQMIQAHAFFHEGKFSGQWLFDGVADRWGRKVASWDDVLRKPEQYKGLYILDLDNGTARLSSEKLSNCYYDRSLKKVKERV